MTDITQGWVNPVKKKLEEGRAVVGATVTVASPDVAAHLANMAFDFLWIEMEHSPITLETLRNMLLAVRGLPAVPFARVPVNELWTAKRVLDAGATGVMFPFTSTPELAAQAVAACRYPPLGRRGSGANLARFCWPDPENYPDSADRNVVVIGIIEEARAVDRIDEIAATPGLDVLFIGTSDLSFSLGLRGQQDHPLLNEAVAKVLETGRKHGKYVGRPCADPAKIERYAEQGFRFFQGPTELGMMASGARQVLEPLGKRFKEAKAGPLY